MKKFLSLLLSLVLVFSLTACGSTEPPEPSAISGGDDFIVAAAAIPFLQSKLPNPESMQIYSNIDVIDFYDGLRVYCLTFGADYVPGVYTKAVEAEIYTDGKNCLACWEYEESFIGWRDSIPDLEKEGYKIITVNGEKVASKWGIEYLTLAELEAQQSELEAARLELDDLKVLDYGYFIKGDSLYFAPMVENTGDILYSYPCFNLSAYDEAGAEIINTTCYGGPIYPGQKTAFCIEVGTVESLPACLDCEINFPDSYPVMDYPNSIYSEFIPYEIINSSLEAELLKIDFIDKNVQRGFYRAACVFYDESGEICWAISEVVTGASNDEEYNINVPIICPVKYASFDLFLNGV